MRWITTFLMCVGTVAMMGCGKTESTGADASATTAESAAAVETVEAEAPAPAVVPTITGSFAPANHPEGQLVDMPATGDIDFIALVPTPKIEVLSYMQKKDVDDISVTGSSENTITGFPCLDAISGSITISPSAGYSGAYETVGKETISFDLKLSEASKFIKVFGYSRNAGCVAEVFDVDGNSIAKTELAIGADEKQTWILSLTVDASGSSAATLVVSFADAPADSRATLAVGAVTLGTTDTVAYAPNPHAQ